MIAATASHLRSITLLIQPVRVSRLRACLGPGQPYGVDFVGVGWLGSWVDIGGDQNPPGFDDHVEVERVSFGDVPGRVTTTLLLEQRR